MSSIYVRRARPEDIPSIAILDTAAYRHNGFRRAMFPESRRVQPGVEDQIDWFISSVEGKLDSPGMNFVVAVEKLPLSTQEAQGSTQNAKDEEKVVGYAQWIAPSPPPEHPKDAAPERAPERTPDEKAQAGRERRAKLPSYIDYDAVIEAGKEIEDLLKESASAFTGLNKQQMWTLNAIGVDENQRRKGIGKMLARWGIDKATAAGQDIWLIASPDGRLLYQSLGFREVAAGSRCGQAEYVMLHSTKN